jgi:DNA-directed RNA polymerase specialized sigma24 family protein
VRTPPAVHVDPDWFNDGQIGVQTATTDHYFIRSDERTMAIVADYFVSQLEEPIRSAVEMCIMQNLSYEEAAQAISLTRGKNTDRKTVWRWARKGVEELQKMFSAAQWAGAISEKVPNG